IRHTAQSTSGAAKETPHLHAPLAVLRCPCRPVAPQDRRLPKSLKVVASKRRTEGVDTRGRSADERPQRRPMTPAPRASSLPATRLLAVTIGVALAVTGCSAPATSAAAPSPSVTAPTPVTGTGPTEYPGVAFPIPDDAR